MHLLIYVLSLEDLDSQWAPVWRTSDENELADTRGIDKALNRWVHTTQSMGSPARRYPAALMGEYRALAKKELNGTMTQEEASRFMEIQQQINTIDRQRPRPDIWDIQQGIIREELAQIRAEIEMLPNAE